MSMFVNEEKPTREIGTTYGFYDESMSCYGDDELYNLWMDAFNYMSLVAIVNDMFYCAHGGFPRLLASIQKPINIEKASKKVQHIVEDILWSDPIDSKVSFVESDRGKGVNYGYFAVCEFLHKCGLRGIIRGHSVAENGVFSLFKHMVITVFFFRFISQRY